MRLLDTYVSCPKVLNSMLQCGQTELSDSNLESFKTSSGDDEDDISEIFVAAPGN